MRGWGIGGGGKNILDYFAFFLNNFGFFIGAYLAEGTITETQVIIANNDDKYLDKIKNFADEFNIKYHIQCTTNKRFENSKSQDIRLHSKVLTKLPDIKIVRKILKQGGKLPLPE